MRVLKVCARVLTPSTRDAIDAKSPRHRHAIDTATAIAGLLPKDDPARRATQMEIRGQDLCLLCRAELHVGGRRAPAKLEHWAAKDARRPSANSGRATGAATSASRSIRPRPSALYERAVELGDAKAVVHLGLMLADGDGCPKDEPRATALFDGALESEGPLGAVGRERLGPPRHGPPRGREALAAGRGRRYFSIAMANLGMLYEGRFSYAKAFPTDLEAAKMWYQAAAEHGREDAAFNLQRLRAATTSKGRMTHAFRAFEGLAGGLKTPLYFFLPAALAC